ncbi:MAG: response regulator [Deltaproteobacteria bacterium]|nr:response regulator [Deltaproteobacteria bacterium]
MTDNAKTKADLLDEINALRARIIELEEWGAGKDVYQEALRTILDRTALMGGDDFFRSMVRNVASTLKFKYVFVGELSGPGRIRTLAVWTNGALGLNFEYDIEDAPCKGVIGKELCFYPSAVQKLFPNDKTLAKLNVESYIGVPLFDVNGKAMGILAAMDTAPIEKDAHLAEIFVIFSIRAAFEMERKRAENELKRLAERLTEAQEIAHIGSWELDAASGEIFWSDQTYKLFGYEPGGCEPGFESTLARVDNGDKVRFARYAKDCRSLPNSAKKSCSIDYRITLPDGSVRRLHGKAELIRDPSGAPERVAGTVQDFTWRDKVEAELLQAQKLESIGELAGGIAHDFNNLLTGIVGSVSIAKERLRPEDPVYSLMNQMEKAALRTKSLTSQLLTFSRGGEPVKNISNVTQLVRDTAQLVLRDSGCELTFDAQEDVWPVEVDEAQISQVINNIVHNARHAVVNGGTIGITLRNVVVGDNDGVPLEAGDYVRITVKDTGKGISAKHIHRVFDPFFTTKDKASGLGLAVSYSIVKRHKGHISVESKEGFGAAFNVYLNRAGVVGQTEEKPLVGNGKVLVVDDEELVRDVALDMLRLLGYEARSAVDGASAVELYKKAQSEGAPFSAVIMDLTMPGMSGMEAMQKILAIDKDARGMVSSGFSKDPIMSEYKNHGFKAVLVKPYRMSEFSKAVKSVIDNEAV